MLAKIAACLGAGNRTRTCTLLAVEPKSTESTNSTMPAKKPLFLHGGGTEVEQNALFTGSSYHIVTGLSMKSPGQMARSLDFFIAL